jgi:hypothetical protein
MNQQPDKLFRDKLSGLSRPVPSAAWDRINQGLQPPVRKGFPWKIAASILLPLVAGAAIYLHWHDNATTGPVADQGNTPATTPHVQATPAKTDTTTAADKTAPVAVPAPVQRNTYTAHAAAATPRRAVTTPAKPSAVIPEPTHLEAMPTQTETPRIADAQTSASTGTTTAATATTQAKTVVAASERSMTLVFNARETEAYLDKNSIDEATEDGKDASTFKKLLQKARDLKTNQDPIGDLRLKKNEILALNFKNDKRGQNK